MIDDDIEALNELVAANAAECEKLIAERDALRASVAQLESHVERQEERTTATKAQQKELPEREYPAERGLAEIVRILAAPDAGKGAGDAT